MRLVSMLTENYVPRARPFLSSLQRLPNIDCCIIGLGFNPYPLHAQFPHVGDWAFMPRHWSESSLGILQHGRWLDAFLLGVHDDEVLLLIDADIVIQRDFTPEERQRFESCGENSFLAGWNAGQDDMLGEEAERIGFKDDGTYGSESCADNWQEAPCFNTGVLAMRGRSWKRLRDLYESRCERFYKLTSHRSRGQFLMCWCLDMLELRPEILTPETHAHGHMGIPKGVTFRDGVAYYRDKVILFRHAF